MPARDGLSRVRRLVSRRWRFSGPFLPPALFEAISVVGRSSDGIG
jgi:hypothetical protein